MAWWQLRRDRLRPVVAVLTLAVLAGCAGRPIGARCERTGDGFLARDPCRHCCLAWPVTCGDGREVPAPGVCSGAPECWRDSCPAGEVCARAGGNNYCVPVVLCPSGVGIETPPASVLLERAAERAARAAAPTEAPQ